MIRSPIVVANFLVMLLVCTVDAHGEDKDWPRVYDGTSTYREIPAGQFLEIFSDLEVLCRKVLSERDEHLAELKKKYSDQQAQAQHETLFYQCRGSVGSRMSVARLYGYKMRWEDALNPEFWARLDTARANLQ